MNTITYNIPESLENNIIRFVYILRTEGLRVGNSEVIDALQALQLVPLDDREKVKISLKVTLIKKAADYGLFERTFDLFFTSPEIRDGLRKLRQEKVEEQKNQLQKAGEVLSFRGEKMNLSETEKTVYSYMPEKEKKRLKDFLEMNESRDTLQRDYRPFLESLVKGRLRFWHKQLHHEIEKGKVSPDLGDENVSSIRDAAAGSGQGGSAILTEDMQYIARKDLPRATSLIRKMARLLVTRISRRYRHSKRRRALDLRSTIRSSIQYGGAPFRLRYKSHRVKKPKLMLLCDVSGSMIRYTSFVLQFIYGLNTAVQRIESFIFSENLERVTPYFQQGNDFESTMAALVKESNVWGGGTSLHQALQTLLNKYEDELTRNTIIIIVSDTRTIRHQEALDELQRLKGKVKEILWLNTLPQDEWDNYSTVTAFRKLANMFPCNTLADLERVMSRKLLSA